MSQGTAFQEDGVLTEVHEVYMEVHGVCVGWMESLERSFQTLMNMSEHT